MTKKGQWVFRQAQVGTLRNMSMSRLENRVDFMQNILDIGQTKTAKMRKNGKTKTKAYKNQIRKNSQVRKEYQKTRRVLYWKQGRRLSR